MSGRVITRAAVGFLLCLGTGCRAEPGLHWDHDPAADFSRFRSFKFVVMPATYRRGYPTRLTRQIALAITDEMVKRGYEPVPAYPDLLINFSVNLPKKGEKQLPHSYYEYRYYPAWPGYARGFDMDMIEYEQGTFNVDVIRTSPMQLVWEGVVIGALTQTHSQERDVAIHNAVVRMLDKFPSRAVPTQPVQSPSG